MAKDREEERKQQEWMEKAITKTCNNVMDVQVREDGASTEKVVNLTLTMKDSKDTMAKFKFEYEVHISEL